MAYGDSGILLRLSPERRVSWVRGGEVVRVPEERKLGHTDGFNFTVADRTYNNLSALYRENVDASRRLYRDVFGRYVLDMKDRYPCFDSYDFMYENRYYHWYLILEEDRLSMVYNDEGLGGVDLTEDVARLPYTPWSVLNYWHYLDEDGILRLDRKDR